MALLDCKLLHSGNIKRFYYRKMLEVSKGAVIDFLLIVVLDVVNKSYCLVLKCLVIQACIMARTQIDFETQGFQVWL